MGFADDEEVLDKLRQKLRPRRGQSLLDFWNALTEEQLTGRLQKAGVEEFDLKADVEAVRAKLAEYPQVTSPLAPCYTKVLRIPRKWGPEIGTGAAVMDVVTDCVTAFKTLRKVSPCRNVSVPAEQKRLKRSGAEHGSEPQDPLAACDLFPLAVQWVIGSFLVGFVGTWYFVFFANGRDGRRLVDEEVLRRDVR